MSSTLRLNRQLALAIGNGDAMEVRRLVAAGANVKERDEFDRTPLIRLAAEPGLNAAEVARSLLELGADPNAQNQKHMTPLMEAALKHHPEMVRVLLERGASITLRNREGKSALDYARGEVLTLILEASRDLRAKKRA